MQGQWAIHTHLHTDTIRGAQPTCQPLTSGEIEVLEGNQGHQMGQGTVTQLLTAPQRQMSKLGECSQHGESSFCQAQTVPQDQMLQAAQTLNMV